MQAITSLIHRLLGLLHPDWDLRLGPGPGAPLRRRGERGLRLGDVTQRGRAQGDGPVEELVRCDFDETTLQDVELAGLCALSTFRLATFERPSAAPGARMEGCALESAEIEGGDLSELNVVACDLRELRARRVRVGGLSLCDLYGARLERVRLDRAVACDFTGASLSDCDLRGADLRGSSFRRADLKGCDLTGALVEGVDIVGARGLSAEVRRSLIRRGARAHGAGVTVLLQRIRPKGDPLQLDRLATGLRLGGWLAGAGISAAALAAVLTPPPPPDAPDLPPPLQRIVTEEDRQRTQQNLRALRENIQRAHELMLERGAVHRTWPTVHELIENRFDMDGDASGEDYDVLVAGGYPQNYLSDAEEVVLPYCNEEPAQETITGVDADWHYCELTGRIFASAAYTEEATLNW